MGPDYPKQTVSAVLSLPRSTLYYQPLSRDEAALKAALVAVAGEFPTYGYRRVTAELQRRDWKVNRKHVAGLMRELGLKTKIKRKTRRTTNSDHPFPRYANLVQDLSISRPDQVWVADITYVRLQRDFVYLAVIMDVFTRSIRGWHLGRGLDQDLTLTALQKALAEQRPEIHHSDQGLQYAALAYTQLLQNHGAQISTPAPPPGAGGGSRRADPEWLCGKIDAHHQRGGS
jgi:putative transposase